MKNLIITFSIAVIFMQQGYAQTANPEAEARKNMPEALEQDGRIPQRDQSPGEEGNTCPYGESCPYSTTDEAMPNSNPENNPENTAQ